MTSAESKHKLISSDNKEFIVSEAVIKQNDIWMSFYEVGSKPEEEIPIPEIDGKTLKRVVEFCEKFAKDPPYKYDDANERASLRTDYRVLNFFKEIKSSNTLNELITAANYLNNKRLIDVCLLHIHRNLEGRDVEGIRKALHLENDFTAEEERAFRQINPNGFFLPLHLQMHLADLGDMDFLQVEHIDLQEGAQSPVYEGGV